MKKVILSTLAALSLMISSIVVVSATTQGTQCNQSDPIVTYFYENIVGDTSDGNDALIRCGDAKADMGDISHTIPGDCHASPFNKVTWNNCVSSVLLDQPPNYRFCGYRDINYGGTLLVNRLGESGRFNITGDELSSYKNINAGPSGAGQCP